MGKGRGLSWALALARSGELRREVMIEDVLYHYRSGRAFAWQRLLDLTERPRHATELTRLFPDARLLVLPGGHGEYLGEVTFPLVDAAYPELTARLIARFLDAPSD